MTMKPTRTKTPKAEELKDEDLDAVQGGLKPKGGSKGTQLTHDPVFEELKGQEAKSLYVYLPE